MMNITDGTPEDKRAGGLWMYASGLSRFFMTSTLLIASFATYQRVNVPYYTRDDVIEESWDRSADTWCAPFPPLRATIDQPAHICLPPMSGLHESWLRLGHTSMSRCRAASDPR